MGLTNGEGTEGFTKGDVDDEEEKKALTIVDGSLIVVELEEEKTDDDGHEDGLQETDLEELRVALQVDG